MIGHFIAAQQDRRDALHRGVGRRKDAAPHGLAVCEKVSPNDYTVAVVSSVCR
jgi:hypothetical protein